MKQLKKVITFILGFALVVTAFTGCKKSESTEKGEKLKEVNVGILNGLSSTTLIIASKKGFLKEEFDKIDVKVNEVWIASGGGPAIVNAMESNSINVGGMADQPAIQAAANDGTEKIVGVYSQSDKYVQLVVPKDSTAKSITELKGKKITVGIGTIGHRVLFAMIAAAGLKPEDFEILNTPDGNLITTLDSGFADAAVTTEPTASKLDYEGEINIIGNTEGVKTNYTVLVSTGEFLAEHPEGVEAFLKAVKKSIDYLNDPANHEEAVALLAEAAEVKPEVVELALAKFEFNIALNNAAVNSIQDSADIMYDMEIIRKEVKAEDFIDTGFLESLGYQDK